MFANAGLFKLLAGACLWGVTTLAFAQAAVVNQKLGEFKAASQELVKLYAGVKDEASAKAAAAQLAAANKRQDAAEAALHEGMKKLDHKSPQDGKLMESALGELQASNLAVADAHMKANEREAAAKAAAAKAAAKPAAEGQPAAKAEKKK